MKITLYEFFKMPYGRTCIHCKTQDEAKLLCKAFDKMGKTWAHGSPYSDDSQWYTYREETVYYNDGYFADVVYAERRKHIILKFSDIILCDSEVLSKFIRSIL